jgi:ABC-2 type transport system ATP-binding protein
MNMIEADRLGKRFRHAWALRDCGLSVPAGHVVALVGPNGAGKTTLLRLLAGLGVPSAGQVTVLGGYRPGSAAARDEVAYVDQQMPLYRNLRVRDVLRVAEAMNSRWGHDLAEERLAALGIPVRRKAGKLSGGQQAQLALTLAIARRPRLLLLDEPLSSLDPLARQDVLATLMTSVAEDGLSVVFSSHVVSELERVASYLIVLSGGQVQVAATVESLLAGHRALIGPAQDADRLAEQVPVVTLSRVGRQAQALARTATAPSGWADRSVTMEEIVLGYLSEPSARALPGPVVVP